VRKRGKEGVTVTGSNWTRKERLGDICKKKMRGGVEASSQKRFLRKKGELEKTWMKQRMNRCRQQETKQPYPAAPNPLGVAESSLSTHKGGRKKGGNKAETQGETRGSGEGVDLKSGTCIPRGQIGCGEISQEGKGKRHEKTATLKRGSKKR